MTSRFRRRLIFWPMLAVLNLAMLYAAFRTYIWWTTRELYKISRIGWEAGFKERGLQVPPDGPREGYWGSRLGSTKRHPEFGWILPELHIPKFLDLDSNGMQHAGRCENCPRILIVGASTAFGAYASTIENTYFSQFAADLERAGVPARVDVLAAGAWKSIQERKAFLRLGLPLHPDLTIFLNGLNDLTNGSNAHTLFGVKTKTKDGSRWHVLYHEHDYDERVRLYLANMAANASALRATSGRGLFILQPASFEKKTLTPTEAWIEEWSLRPHESKARLRAAYDAMRQGLAQMADCRVIFFSDATAVFDKETATIFTDFWHFADRGHETLAEFMARQVVPILRREREDHLQGASR